MIKTYLKLQFDSDGAKPSEVIRILKGIGCSPIIGDFDFEKGLKLGESLFEALDAIHEALKGTGVQYSVTTRTVPDTEPERQKEAREATPRKNAAEERILQSLDETGSSANSISKKLSLPKDEVEQILERLFRAGVLTRKKRGRYYIYLRK